MTDRIISTENIGKTYKTLVDEVIVLENINVSINRGDAVAIMGESGRGKTTLLNILSALDRPTAGKVYFNDERIDDLDERALAVFRNRNVGFIFQHHYLLDDFTAIENVLVPVRIGKPNLEESDRDRAMELLTAVGLEKRADHYPDQLSGGERQRVAVVRALINEPLVIFADEPTGSLDRKNAENVERLMWQLKDQFNKTLVIATHSQEIAKQCNDIIYLE